MGGNEMNIRGDNSMGRERGSTRRRTNKGGEEGRGTEEDQQRRRGEEGERVVK